MPCVPAEPLGRAEGRAARAPGQGSCPARTGAPRRLGALESAVVERDFKTEISSACILFLACLRLLPRAQSLWASLARVLSPGK